MRVKCIHEPSATDNRINGLRNLPKTSGTPLGPTEGLEEINRALSVLHQGDGYEMEEEL